MIELNHINLLNRPTQGQVRVAAEPQMIMSPGTIARFKYRRFQLRHKLCFI